MAAAKKTTSAAAQAGTEASPRVHPDIRPDARPGYSAEACKQVVKKDRAMKGLHPQSGNATLQPRGDAFTTLARSIVGQQISVKAAQTVWERFALLPCSMKPAN